MSTPNYPAQLQRQLKQLMIAAHIPSYQSLCERAQVSRSQLQYLRQGNWRSLRVETLQQLAAVFALSVPQLLAYLETQTPVPSASTAATDYRTGDTTGAPPDPERQFQVTSLQTLTPWLLQWATVVHAVQKNPDLPASRLVPLVQPVETLMRQWGVTAIAPVGAEVPFDPTCHELMGGVAQPGERVRVRYAGYRHGDRLLHRAKVSPVSAKTS